MAEFRQVFEVSYQPLVAYARRRVASWSDADDLVGEVYATAWRRRDEFDPTVSPLPWLYGIAGNVVRNQRRSNQRQLKLVDHLGAQPEGPTSADPAERPGTDLRVALAQLSFDDQEVLRLIAWEGLSHSEAGEALGCSTNAVGIRIHRARQRLDQQLHHPAPTSQKDLS
jgi:RNA polymerase sigma-70 factor, ECF subfamily